MEPQERDLLTTLLARLKNTANQPKDPEADALIRQAITAAARRALFPRRRPC